MSQSSGDERQADARLSESIYDKLHDVACAAMRAERIGHTLQPTALIHEAYLKLRAIDGTIVDDNHFLALAAIQMRRVLVEGARARGRKKRTPGEGRVLLHGSDGLDLGEVPDGPEPDLDERMLRIDAALERLEVVAPRPARLVVLRFFGGLSIPEAARALELSDRSAARDWQVAKLFLQNIIGSA